MRAALRLLTAMTGILALAAAAGCGNASPQRHDGATAVVASTNVWGDIAQQIGGSAVAVESLITDPSQDPHTFQPSGRNQLAVSRAAIVIENGGGYDDVMTVMLAAVHSRAIVVTAVDAAAAAGLHVDANEHVWYDLTAVSAVAGRIADALVKVRPAAQAAIQTNLADFRAALRPLEDAVRAIKARHGGAPVAITEPLPLYLIESAGLHNVTPPEFSDAIEEGIDVTPAQLATMLALFDEHRVDVLVYNSQSAGSQTDRVVAAANDNQVPVVDVTELLAADQHYQDWMRHTIEALAQALDKGVVR